MHPCCGEVRVLVLHACASELVDRKNINAIRVAVDQNENGYATKMLRSVIVNSERIEEISLRRKVV